MTKTLPEDEKLEARISSHISGPAPVIHPPADGIIERLIGEARDILVICHVDPDGDAVGSLLGMGWALRKMGKTRTLLCADTVLDQFSYLPGFEEITSRVPDNPDLVIALDCSDHQRMGNAYASRHPSGIPTINIDHHVTNTNFGTLNWVDPRATATSEMVLGLIERLGVSLDATIAICLLNGIVTDTLGFRTPNTTAQLHHTAVTRQKRGNAVPEQPRTVKPRTTGLTPHQHFGPSRPTVFSPNI